MSCSNQNLSTSCLFPEACSQARVCQCFLKLQVMDKKKKSVCVLRLWKFMFELASVSVGSMECGWVYAVLTALWNIFEKTKYEMEVGNIEICAVFSFICQKLKLFLNFKGEIRLEITVNMETILKRNIIRVFLTCRVFFMTFLHISHSWTDL